MFGSDVVQRLISVAGLACVLLVRNQLVCVLAIAVVVEDLGVHGRQGSGPCGVRAAARPAGQVIDSAAAEVVQAAAADRSAAPVGPAR